MRETYAMSLIASRREPRLQLNAAMAGLAYRQGLFPMPDGRGGINWLSPNPRAFCPLHAFHSSLRCSVAQKGRLFFFFHRRSLTKLSA